MLKPLCCASFNVRKTVKVICVYYILCPSQFNRGLRVTFQCTDSPLAREYMSDFVSQNNYF